MWRPRPRDPVVDVDVLVDNVPALFERVRPGVLDLPPNALRVSGDGLVRALASVNGGGHLVVFLLANLIDRI